MKLNPQKYKRSSELAFTFVETLVASAGLVMMVGAFYLGIGQMYICLENTRQDLRATQILVEKFESLRLFNWDQLTKSNNFVPASWSEHYDFQQNKGVLYHCSVNFTNYGNYTYSTNIKLMTISVSWTNKGPHTRKLQSLVARDGVQNYAF